MSDKNDLTRNNDSATEDEKINAPEISDSVPFLKKLDNFWFHHKWKTIIAAVLVIVISIASFQMCTKESYDSFILYAGNHYIHSSSYPDVITTVKPFMTDSNGDGEVTVSFKNLYILSSDEMREMEDDGKEPAYTLISENLELYDQYLQYDTSYYIFIISPYLFERSKIDGQYVFADIRPYVGSSQIEYVKNEDGTDNYAGVLLSSTGLGDAPIFRDMPEGTIIAIRRLSITGQIFGNKASEENYKKSEEALKKILAS